MRDLMLAEISSSLALGSGIRDLQDKDLLSPRFLCCSVSVVILISFHLVSCDRTSAAHAPTRVPTNHSRPIRAAMFGFEELL